MDRQIPFQFDIQIDESELTPTNDPELYRGKVRVFYKYQNRNGSFITDKFADKFALTAYSKPIVGTYSLADSDFMGHEDSQLKKAYGYVIPGSLEWQDHLDSDGVNRTYATYDVVIWGEYFPEAKIAFGKSQSMEIDPKTIQGEWKVIDVNTGLEAFVYTEGIMAGLCLLGNSRTPCFEGAAFFSMEDEDYIKFTNAISKYVMNGGNNMDELENTPVEEKQEITEMEEIKEEVVELAPEEKDELSLDNDFVQIQPSEPEATHEVNLNAETAEASVEEENSQVEANVEDSEFKSKYDALTEEFNKVQEQYNQLVNQYNDMEKKYSDLVEDFKKKTCACEAQSELIGKYEAQEKQRIIDKFSKCLPADVMQEISNESANMTINDLNTRCAVEYTTFSMAKENGEEIRIPQPAVEPESALFTLLKKYKRQ